MNNLNREISFICDSKIIIFDNIFEFEKLKTLWIKSSIEYFEYHFCHANISHNKHDEDCCSIINKLYNWFYIVENNNINYYNVDKPSYKLLQKFNLGGLYKLICFEDTFKYLSPGDSLDIIITLKKIFRFINKENESEDFSKYFLFELLNHSATTYLPIIIKYN